MPEDIISLSEDCCRQLLILQGTETFIIKIIFKPEIRYRVFLTGGIFNQANFQIIERYITFTLNYQSYILIQTIAEGHSRFLHLFQCQCLEYCVCAVRCLFHTQYHAFFRRYRQLQIIGCSNRTVGCILCVCLSRLLPTISGCITS